MRFGAVQRMAGGRQLRNAHFENESTFPLTTACLVANGVRERFAQKLGCARAVDLFEPVAVTCVLMDRLLTGAMVFAVDAPAGRFWLVFSPRSVVALVSAAFGERGARQPGALSGLENKALHTMVRELATLCAPLYGEANNLVLTHDYMPMYKAASYFEIRIALDLPVYIGILLDRDPSEQKSGSAVGAAQLAEVPFSVRSVAGSCAITLARLGALEIGDVLPMIRGETAHLITGSAVLAHGTCGIANGRNAFLVGTSGESTIS